MPGAANRSASNVIWFLELNGVNVGAVRSADFPTPTSLILKIGTGMSKQFYDWMFRGYLQPRGSVVTTDYSGNVVYRDDWESGCVTRVEMPPMDAASRESAYIRSTVRLRGVALNSKQANQKYTTRSAVTRGISKCNFSLELDGLDGRHVSAVSGVTTRRGDILSLEGPAYGAEPVPAPEARNSQVQLQILESKAASFRRWQQSGNVPKGGSLKYLASDLKTAIFTASFQSLTVAGIVPAVPTNPSEVITISLASKFGASIKG